MVQITFTRDSRSRLSRVFATGHADARQKGEDVVCAAVSAILQAAYAGLEDVAKIAVEGRRDPGDLEIRIPDSERDRVDVSAIVRTAEVSLEQIARQYPAFVRVSSASES